MPSFVKVALLTVVLASAASSQSTSETQPERIMAAVEARFAAWEQQQRAAEQWREQQFLQRAKEFVRAWNDFVEDYNHNRFDIRKARKLSEAFRKLERAGGWPKVPATGHTTPK